MASRKAAKAPTNGQQERKGLATTVFIPSGMQTRLARFMLEKFAGRMHVRNQVILEALDAMLQKEGF
jgi:hypothetical protein